MKWWSRLFGKSNEWQSAKPDKSKLHKWYREGHGLSWCSDCDASVNRDYVRGGYEWFLGHFEQGWHKRVEGKPDYHEINKMERNLGLNKIKE